MTGRKHIGEVMTQIWLNPSKMSELLYKQVNAQKESMKNYFQGSCKLLQAHQKCVIKMKETNKKKNIACIKCY